MALQLPPVPENSELSFTWKDWFRIIRIRLNKILLGYFDGDILITNSAKGLVLIDTQATPHYWRITVDNTGILVTTDLGTVYP